MNDEVSRGRTPAEADFLRRLGAEVRGRRRARKMTQGRFGAAAGVSRNFVNSVERGRVACDVLFLARLAAAFGVPPGTLLRDAVPADEVVLRSGAT